MSAKYYACTHCRASNKVEQKDFADTIKDNAGETFGKALLALAAGALTAPLGGIGGVVVGTLFTVDGARNYFTLECGNCGRRFPVKRWEE